MKQPKDIAKCYVCGGKIKPANLWNILVNGKYKFVHTFCWFDK